MQSAPEKKPGEVVAVPCPFCGNIGHAMTQCPRVRAIEFHPGVLLPGAWLPGAIGPIARVEFLTPADLGSRQPTPPTNPNKWPVS